jgi:hypothetical protein
MKTCLPNPHWHEYITDLVAEEREGVGGSSRTNLCREWSSCSPDGRRGRIRVDSWPEAAGSSSWPGTTSMDQHQPYLGWPEKRPHTNNRLLVTVVTQGAVGLEKSRATTGRERRRWARRERRRRAGRVWGPCVVRGPVDGRFLVWWVIDNVVWTNSWLSIAGAGCDLTGVGAGEEQARKVIADEASRCGEDK